VETELFALGSVLYEIETGCVPYVEMVENTVEKGIRRVSFRM
jgi:hypothetical protein